MTTNTPRKGRRGTLSPSHNATVSREARDRQVEAIKNHPMFTGLVDEVERLFAVAFANAYDSLTAAERMDGDKKLSPFKATLRKVEARLSDTDRASFKQEFETAKDTFWKLLYKEEPYEKFQSEVIAERQAAEQARFDGLTQSLAPLLADATV